MGERELDLVPFIVCCRPGGAVGRAYIPVFVDMGLACSQQFQLYDM